MDKLFRQLARGEVPTVLDVMQALNDVSDLWPGNCCLDCRPKSSEFPGEKSDTVQRKSKVRKT